MKRIKKDDTVIVQAGKSKKHVGKVLKVVDNQVLVEGANIVKKHVKPNPQINQQGGIVPREALLDISNVAIYNPATKKADKVGFKFVENNGQQQKVRYFKSNGEHIDLTN
jgi:large subunit ribosomal protein L24